MARSRETKIELTAYDDLFQTDESREEAKLSKIRDISISESSPKENVQVGRDNAVCIFVLLISGKYNRCRLVNVGGERYA
mgnify:FL=1